MTVRKAIALIAHDQKKDDLAAFARTHEAALARFLGVSRARVTQVLNRLKSLAENPERTSPDRGNSEVA